MPIKIEQLDEVRKHVLVACNPYVVPIATLRGGSPSRLNEAISDYNNVNRSYVERFILTRVMGVPAEQAYKEIYTLTP